MSNIFLSVICKKTVIHCLWLLGLTTAVSNALAPNNLVLATESIKKSQAKAPLVEISATAERSSEEKSFFKSKNVKWFLRNHPHRKFVLQKTMAHLNHLEESEKAFLLKNLRQIGPSHFRSFIEELRNLKCHCDN